LASRLVATTRRAVDPPTATPVSVIDAAFTKDSVIAVVTSNGTPQTQRVSVPPGAMPYVNPSFALLEQALIRAKSLGGAKVELPLLNVSGGQPIPTTVTWSGMDSAVVTMAGSQVRLAVDGEGRIRGGQIVAQRLTIERVGAVSEKAMAVDKPDYSAPTHAPYTA